MNEPVEPFEGYCDVVFTERGILLGAREDSFGIPESLLLPQHDVDPDVVRTIIDFCQRDFPKGSMETAKASLAHQLEQGGFTSERDMVKRGSRTGVLFHPEYPIDLLRSFLETPKKMRWRNARTRVEWSDATIENLTERLDHIMNADTEALMSL